MALLYQCATPKAFSASDRPSRDLTYKRSEILQIEHNSIKLPADDLSRAPLNMISFPASLHSSLYNSIRIAKASLALAFFSALDSAITVNFQRTSLL